MSVLREIRPGRISGREGRVRRVWKIQYAFVNLPLPRHAQAQAAAEAAECAHADDRFWPLHDRLTHEYGPFSCQYWCENLMVYTIAPNSCTLDAGACGDGGNPITVAWYASVEYVDEYGSYQQPINDFQGCS